MQESLDKTRRTKQRFNQRMLKVQREWRSKDMGVLMAILYFENSTNFKTGEYLIFMCGNKYFG